MQALLMTAIHKLELVDAPIPALERPDEVLIKVKSVGVCGSDLHGYTGHTGRRIPPLIMGHEATGEVVAVGDAVKDWTPGSRVATQTVAFCGYCAQCKAGQHSLCENRRIMGMSAPGAYAEYVKWPAASLSKLPDSLSYEHGALVEPLSIAVHAVGLAHIKPYDSAMIVGAGPIGLLTLAVLRFMGVRTIAVSDMSDERLEIARSMGAQVTINPSRHNPRDGVNEFTNGGGVDITFEAVGLSATAQQSLEVTRNKGTVVWIGNNQRKIEVDMQAIVTRELRVLGSYGMSSEEFERSIQMLADGRIPAELLINRRATLDEGPILFDQLLESPEVIKCVINF
jgi:L-iditol 2-dehydrogenase